MARVAKAVLAAALVAAALAGVARASCAVTDEETGKYYDLSKLVRTSGEDWIAKDSVENNNYTYRINLCRPIMYQGDKSITIPPDTGLHQQRKDAPSRHHKVGQIAFPRVTDGVLYMDFEYGELCTSNMANRSARITFSCLENSKDLGNPVLIGEDHCFYQFAWPSAAACPVTGMSGGAIFLIVLVSLIAAYIIFGVLYRRLVIGATGWKQFPNHEFWGAVLSAIWCCGGSKTVQYRQIPRGTGAEGADLLDDLHDDEFDDDAVETADGAGDRV